MEIFVNSIISSFTFVTKELKCIAMILLEPIQEPKFLGITKSIYTVYLEISIANMFFPLI